MNIQEEFELALQYLKTGNVKQAENHLMDILQVNPNNATVLHLLGVINFERKNYDAAIQYSIKVIQLDPTNVDALYNLGNALREKKHFEEAVMYYSQALQLNPHVSDIYYNLGTIYQDLRNFDKAIACYDKVLQLKPDDIDAHFNMGNAFRDQFRFEEAIACYRKAVQLNTNLADAYNNIATVFHEKGLLDKADQHFRHAVQIEPENITIHQNFLCSMLYNVRYDAQSIFGEHLKFTEHFGRHLSNTIPPYSNQKTMARSLKLGYVSPDFRKHSVSYFIEPVLVAHSNKDFQIYCYSDVSQDDEVTESIRRHAGQWRSIAGMSDEQVADLIRSDRIDILVDLSGLTEYNRWLVFARKAAPVQITWLGYPATTGLPTMDYKIVDSYTDPPGLTDQFYTEKLIRVPGCYLCYLPDRESPDVGTLPALSTGHITFGSFNNFAKVTPEVMELWAKVLNTVSDSRCIIKAKSLSDTSTREYVRNIFIKKGVDTNRVELLGWESSVMVHLNTYNRIDIALDTFPYNGTTTTCEALWMGVPVITLAGTTHASRVGVSLLSNVGLPEMIALTTEEYVAKAVDLARDLDKLQSLRKSLRDMMSRAPLTDAKKFTLNLEECYRGMWANWCAKNQ